MTNSRRRRHSSYGNLWLASKPREKYSMPKSEEELQIEQLMLEADLCEDLEGYIRTLSLGMQRILSSQSLTVAALENPVFEAKMKRIGIDITEKCFEDSDLYYVGVFASLKLSENWLDMKFYALLAALIDQVMRRGLKISDLLKRKIKAKLLKFMSTHDLREQMEFFSSTIKLTQ